MWQWAGWDPSKERSKGYPAAAGHCEKVMEGSPLQQLLHQQKLRTDVHWCNNRAQLTAWDPAPPSSHPSSHATHSGRPRPHAGASGTCPTSSLLLGLLGL